MKLVIDGRYTKTGYHDGISRYGAQLIAAVHEAAERTPEVRLQVLVHDTRQQKMLPKGPEYVIINRPDSIAELFVSRKLNRLKADVVFSPMQIIGGFRRSKRNYALILTLHDLIYYDYPDPPGTLPGWQKLLWRCYHKTYVPQRLLLNRADRVATISETTKNLMTAHRLTKRPVDIIGNAPTISAETLAALRPNNRSGADRKSLVYMGSFTPYKNVPALIDVANNLPDYTLHLLSPITATDRNALERRSRLRNVVFHNGVSDKKYYDLVVNATALISLSYSEGYGLPVVESMALGTPVVISDIPIFREIAGTAALYVDPRHTAKAINAIRSLEDGKKWETMSALGAKQARMFSWKTSARTLIKIAEKLTTERRSPKPNHADPS